MEAAALARRVAQLEEELAANKQIKESLETMYEDRLSSLSREADDLRSRLLAFEVMGGGAGSSSQQQQQQQAMVRAWKPRGVAGITVVRPPPPQQPQQQQPLQQTRSSDDFARAMQENDAARGDAERAMMEALASLDETRVELVRTRREAELAAAQASRAADELRAQLAAALDRERAADARHRTELLAAQSEAAELRAASASSASSAASAADGDDEFVLVRSEAEREADDLRRECYGLYRVIEELSTGKDAAAKHPQLLRRSSSRRATELAAAIASSDTRKMVAAASDAAARLRKLAHALRGGGGGEGVSQQQAAVGSAKAAEKELSEAVASIEAATLEVSGGADGVSLAEVAALLRKENAQLRTEIEDMETLMRRSLTDVPFVRGLFVRLFDAEGATDRKAAFQTLAETLRFSPEEHQHCLSRFLGMRAPTQQQQQQQPAAAAPARTGGFLSKLL